MTKGMVEGQVDGERRANLILIGFSGTGKSEVGRLLAERLDWRFVELDAEIARRAGKPIPAIFAEDGEASFRALEAQTFREACAAENAVIATGGGLVTAEANRALALASGFVVCLEASPETILLRLRQHLSTGDEAAVRPLLAGEDSLARIRSLKTDRQAFYAACHATVHTDGLSPLEVVDESHRHLAGAGLALSPREASGPVCVRTAAGHYQVMVGWRLLAELGSLAVARHPQARFFVVSDANVFPRYGDTVLQSIRATGAGLRHLILPPGEATKSVAATIELYDWLIEAGAERGDVLVALGGGVIGDLVGFVAATYLRGIHYVQVPTSLLAMVDSSVGGKTAVDHPRGKNLIGAFHPPSLVVADVATLTTLAGRELRSGLAEVVKHAFVLDGGLFDWLERSPKDVLALEPDLLVPAVRRNVWLKARVVMADERERGERALLNYGHTAGHAVEKAADYRLSHGEAVAIGMAAAAELAVATGRLAPAARDRQNRLLAAFGLGLTVPAELGLRPATLREAMEQDKKKEGRALRWVLATGVGAAEVVRDVPDELVWHALEAITK